MELCLTCFITSNEIRDKKDDKARAKERTTILRQRDVTKESTLRFIKHVYLNNPQRACVNERLHRTSVRFNEFVLTTFTNTKLVLTTYVNTKLILAGFVFNDFSFNRVLFN